MEALRKLHNDKKRQLIRTWVPAGSFVLDCGCGRGGDWWKWQAVGARVAAIDPDPASLAEAASRARDMKFDVRFLGSGDIREAVRAGPFDVVCYNFALHYIFENSKILKESLDAIQRAVRPGGLFMGITPERARAELLTNHGEFRDHLGNTLKITGDRLLVSLTDGPFYADGPKSEPLLVADVLIAQLTERGFTCLTWEPMLSSPNWCVSDLYSSFVFRKNS
jgi:ubiquinone/menaquinone biosynthesis C-methylase UbiE